ncbi:MAG: DUF4738 domain-containing protein [Bacteroides graminisolvens]|nr:DUF4738 domain-containing protein [Bacteroides graminisolvens]
MEKSIASFIFVLLLFSCKGGGTKDSSAMQEDTLAKSQLQGIWVDDDSEMPLMKIKGDTIYYSDPQNSPVYFKVQNDTLHTYGNEVTHYHIDKLGQYVFWFHSLSDAVIKLHRSEDADDSLAFSAGGVEVIPTYRERVERDSVVNYDGKRYRAYVYINPSKVKVVKTSYNEDGMSIDNIYYDNVMHICVYEGRKSLYASDITKQMLSPYVSADFLSKSLFSDMQFIGVGPSGFHYQASVCIPESFVCNIVDLYVSFKGKLTMKAAK